MTQHKAALVMGCVSRKAVQISGSSFLSHFGESVFLPVMMPLLVSYLLSPKESLNRSLFLQVGLGW